MSDNPQTPSSDRERAVRLDRDVFTPALQEACRKSREVGAQPIDIVNAAANAYSNMLITLVGRKAAAGLMKEHADHLLRLEEDAPRAN